MKEGYLKLKDYIKYISQSGKTIQTANFGYLLWKLE